ncbi:hypothetical protein [Acidisphaera sp. S103]|uniref:hypothetical protein n=1 Tax=Acidisphaera sp. S103 TaxID=1747223 RepID=UPI00131B6230|nr:hypothetical protein [Acidisphaera sp. S103]
MPETTTETTQPYDRAAIFHDNGPFNPSFMREAIRTLFRTLPLDPDEPQGWSDRRMHAALLGLSALHPRDEIEVMLSVQALSAYHAAAACWRIGMNLGPLSGNNTRHITTACSAARTFDTMLRALERRQAKPLAIPIGRPATRTWEDAPNPTEIITALEETCREGHGQPDPNLTPEQRAAAEALREQQRIEKENEGLDIANTEGILPGGGMILTENPTPQQAAYMGRRLGLMYKREIEENRRKGITKMPKIRGIRPGDLIP